LRKGVRDGLPDFFGGPLLQPPGNEPLRCFDATLPLHNDLPREPMVLLGIENGLLPWIRKRHVIAVAEDISEDGGFEIKRSDAGK